jgi:hypothetical protein
MLLGGIAAAAALLSAAPGAMAVSNLTVDDAGDAADIANDGVCDATGAQTCTLRAAIQEADDNNTAEADTITFAVGLQDATIAAASSLPTIDEPTSIDGCATIGVNHAGPCVGVRSTTGLDTLFPVGGSGVTIAGLAIGGADIGIAGLDGSTELVIRNNWFGVDLPAAPYTADPNTTGVLLKGSDSLVGGTDGASGTSPADRNVFTNESTGVRIFGGDNNEVLGNYIGTRADGTTAGLESEGVEVASETAGPDTATSNQIGEAVSAGAAATTSCDGACNLVSGAVTPGEGVGIDLSGDAGGVESPSSGSTVAGNFVGMDVTGTTLVGNTSNGIKINTALNATVGGPDAADRNFITGPAYALYTEPVFSGSSPLIQNNFFGLNSAGDAIINLPSSNFALAALRASPTQPVLFEDNRLAEQSSDAVRTGSNTVFTGNVFGIGVGGQNLGSASSAIEVSNSAPGIVIGGTQPGDANTIGNAISNGIALNASQGAVIQGNYIGTDAGGADRGNGGPGIVFLTGGVNATPDNNLIGGNTAAAENVISNNSGDAIKDQTLPGFPGTGNVVARNRGSNNGSTANDLFLDLGADGPGNATFNGAIAAPAITSATTEAVSGTAQPNALVRVFKTTALFGSVPGDVTSFIGQAPADGAGNWSLPGGSLNAGEGVSANQTAVSGSSELSPAIIAIAAPIPPGTPSPDTTPPVTTISGKPKVKTRKKKARVTFTFSATEAGSSFACSLDGGPFSPCSSPFSAKLRRGAHTLTVRATDAAGNIDATPASFTTRVKRKR